MDLQPRWDETRTMGGPDLWPDIQERSSFTPPQPRRQRVLAATAAVAVTIAASYFMLDAFDFFNRHGSSEVRPGTNQPVAGNPCQLPIVQPTTLPWLESGAPMPKPSVNELYQRVTWEGPGGTEWDGAYVSVRVLLDDIPEGTEPSPPLPDGTPGTILKRQREWDVFWQPSERYCGSVALYVFLPQTPPDKARDRAIAVANSMAERTGNDVA
jgi:hypothetical protein